MLQLMNLDAHLKLWKKKFMHHYIFNSNGIREGFFPEFDTMTVIDYYLVYIDK